MPSRFRPLLETLEDRTVMDGVPTLTGTYAFHIHVHLSIFINGQALTIPAHIGIDANGIAQPAHTHDNSGVIHIESPVPRTIVLQEFFNNWGQAFDSRHLLNFIADPLHPVMMTVNGQVSTAYGNYVFHDHYDVVLAANGSGTGVLPPASVPNQHFVQQLFQDLLHRQPDANGQAYFAVALDEGLMNRAQVALTVEQSAEFQGRRVEDLYQQYLDRVADPAGESAFVSFLQSGGTVQQVAVTLVNSDEYFQANGGTNAGFVDAFFHNALNRSVDSSALAFFQHALAMGASRADVALSIFHSQEFHEAQVHGIFQQYLHKSADSTGLHFFAGALALGARPEDIVAGVMASEEYFHL